MAQSQAPPPDTEPPAYPGPPIDPTCQITFPQPAPEYPGHPDGPTFQVSQPMPVSIAMVDLKPTAVPGHMKCPYCNTTVLTEVKYKAGAQAWTLCLALALAMCYLCCWIPLCLKTCKETHHYCPNCHKVIHVHK